MRTFTDLEIQPYIGVGPVLFGMTTEQVHQLLGRPTSASKNALGERDESHDGIGVRYSVSDDRVVEVGVVPSVEVTYRERSIFRDPDAFHALCSEDGTPYEHVGFIILLKLGITLTGFHDNDRSQRAVTVFTRGRWDEKLQRFKPFQLPPSR